MAKTEQELKEQAEREAAKLKKEKELALAEADQEHQGDLAAQKSALENRARLRKGKSPVRKGTGRYRKTGQAKKIIG